jgi:polysaccharide biosynthesis transport protein
MKHLHLLLMPQTSWPVTLPLGGILAVLAVTVALVGCDASRSSGGYEASVEILVMPQQASFESATAENANVDFLATHIQLIQSPRIIAEAVEQGNLKELPSMAELVASEQVVAHIRKNLDVQQMRDAALMQLRYRGPNQEDCAKVLEAVVLGYRSFLSDTFTDASEDAVELIETALSDLGKELATKEAEYREFRSQAELGPSSGTAAQERLKALEAALTEIDVERAKSEARLEVLEEAPMDTAPVSDKALAEERDSLKTELRILEKQHQKLTDMAAEVEEKVKRLAAFEIEDRLKTQQLERLSELHDTVVARLREINLIKDYGGFLTEIVSPIEVRER